MTIWIGTSGWQYDSWKDRFYPKDLPKRRWLEFYSERFPTVEVNNSFYQLPSDDSFRRWKEESRHGFVVTVKASRYITHIRRLTDAKDSVKLFWSGATKLGNKLGPVLFQLPPNFKADVERLEAFLKILPKNLVAAFEFRDASWETEGVYEALDRAGAAYVLADRPGWRMGDVVTGGWSYVRFHQGRRTTPSYARPKLGKWADHIVSMQAKNVWIYFNNDELGAAVKDAAVMMDLLEDRGLDVARVEERREPA